MILGKTTTFQTIINTPDGSVPMWMVSAEPLGSNKTYYVKNYRNGKFTWTTDKLYGKLYSFRRARQIQANINLDTVIN